MNKSLPSTHSLRELITEKLHAYFSSLDGLATHDLYQLVLSEVEAPLLQIVMQYANQNQSLAAKWLGINRGTLRKLLAQYDLLK